MRLVAVGFIRPKARGERECPSAGQRLGQQGGLVVAPFASGARIAGRRSRNPRRASPAGQVRQRAASQPTSSSRDAGLVFEPAEQHGVLAASSAVLPNNAQSKCRLQAAALGALERAADGARHGIPAALAERHPHEAHRRRGNPSRGPDFVSAEGLAASCRRGKTACPTTGSRGQPASIRVVCRYSPMPAVAFCSHRLVLGFRAGKPHIIN